MIENFLEKKAAHLPKSSKKKKSHSDDENSDSDGGGEAKKGSDDENDKNKSNKKSSKKSKNDDDENSDNDTNNKDKQSFYNDINITLPELLSDFGILFETSPMSSYAPPSVPTAFAQLRLHNKQNDVREIGEIVRMYLNTIVDHPTDNR